MNNQSRQKESWNAFLTGGLGFSIGMNVKIRALRVVLALIPAVAVVGALGACGGASSNPTPSSAATQASSTLASSSPAPSTPVATATAGNVFSFAPDVSADDQKLIRQAIAAADRLRGENSLQLDGPVTIQAADDWTTSNPVCYTGAALRVIVNINCPAWPKFTAVGKASAVGYAYFRVIQLNLAGSFSRIGLSPAWLSVGSSAYFGRLVAVAEGVASTDQLHQCDVWNQLHGPNRPALEATNPSNDGSTALATLAVEFLVKNGGPAPLFAFFRGLSIAEGGLQGSGEAAFSKAFQVDSSKFYSDFAAYRATLVSPPSNPCQ